MEIKNTIEIDVKDFVNKYNKFSTTTAKESYLKTAVKFVDYINFEVVEVLCDQILANSCYDKNGNIKVKRFNEFIEDETILIGEMDNFNYKETFNIKITFLDLEENNIAKDENFSFDLVVTAVQKINE